MRATLETNMSFALVASAQSPTPSASLLNIRRIYLEREVPLFARGQQILKQFPGAERIEVDSHWNIPELFGNEGSAEQWIANKREVLVLGQKKSLSARLNDRSSHFIAPSHSNGCTMACAYCYVPRRKGFANPITTFVNIERICRYLEGHAGRQGAKPVAPDQIDPALWVYDIGENGDCSVDAMISDNVRDLVSLFRRLPNAKASFATKWVNDDLLSYDPQRKTRVRFSLMPQRIATVVDVRTPRIRDRIAAIGRFHDAGYEVHLNFSPVIRYDGWERDYVELFREIDDVVPAAAKRQLKAEVICLTHNEQLHEVNLLWHPKAEDYLWTPELQQTKYSQTGGRNKRYKNNIKRPLVTTFTELLQQHLPYCQVRYAF